MTIIGMEDFQKLGLVYFGIHLHAYQKNGSETKKLPITPKNWQEIDKISMKDVYDWQNGKNVKPNAIAVNTEASNIDVIDIDKPDECSILDKLKDDCKFYVKTHKGYHFYFKKTDLERRALRQIADINTHVTFYTPKYENIDTGEIYKYTLIKKEKLVKMPQYAYDWCKQLIAMKSAIPAQPKKKKTKQPYIFKQPDTINERFQLDTVREIYSILSEANMFESYDDWFKVAYVGRHINNTEEGFKLFDEFSRKVKKFKKEPEINNRKKFYDNGEYDENFDENGVLLWCSKLNHERFKKILQPLYKTKYENNIKKIDTKYIYVPENEKYFHQWNKNGKVLMIKSKYGTGKTYCFKRLIEKYQYKRILFITYRQSLANSLSNELKEKYKFDNYLETPDVKKSDRLIIQLDSIGKICGTTDLYDPVKRKDYDLIVLDEIEGILNHVSFEKLNQPVIYSHLSKLVKNAPKVLCLDGDMHDRSFDFIDDITDEYKIIENTHQPNKKKYIFYSDLKAFDQSIEQDMKNGKKIVIVSMSKAETEKYYSYYKEKYNVIIHNGYERNKNILQNVDEEWIKADILIYSPTVEAGIDFDLPHFDNCYGIINNKSTTFRAFSQMLNRVRQFSSNVIKCFKGKLSYNNDILYRYDELKMTTYKNIEITPLIKTLIHNDVERINSETHFMAAFVGHIKEKGHTFSFHQDKYVKPEKNGQSAAMVSNAKDLSQSEYQKLIERQRHNESLTREENLAVEKFIYLKKWKVDTTVENFDIFDFLSDHWNKNHVLANYKLMRKNKNERAEITKDDNISKTLLYRKIDIVKDIITTVPTFSTFPQFKEYVEEVANKKAFKTLFKNDRQIKGINHVKVLEEIINDYGYTIKKSQSKTKGVKGFKYEIEKVKIIDDYEKAEKIYNEAEDNKYNGYCFLE
jgi:hypothetical protein